MTRAVAVDRDPELLAWLARTLESEGVATTTAARPSEAREQLLGGTPEIVLLDLGLPGGSGTELLQQLRAEHPTAVFVVTGDSDVESAVEALRLGASDYLTRPFDAKRLKAAIAGALSRAETSFVSRATEAFRRQLSELQATSGLPEEDPETLGRRAALTGAAGLAWSEHAGPFVDTQAVMSLLGGVSKQAVSQRVKAGRMLALRTGSGRLVYPLWQFQGGDVLAGLPEVLDTVGYRSERSSTGWFLASWLVTDDPELGGSPRELLAAGRPEPVLQAARDVRTELGTDELSAAQGSEAA